MGENEKYNKIRMLVKCYKEKKIESTELLNSAAFFI